MLEIQLKHSFWGHLACDDLGQWWIRRARGPWHALVLHYDTVALPSLILLYAQFRRGARLRLVLGPWSASADELRRLRVALRLSSILKPEDRKR